MNRRLLKKRKKQLLELKRETIINNLSETENLEKTFPIEVIASTFENRLLIDYKLIEDFWKFITNENVNLGNIERFIPIIKMEIINQYPNIKIRNYCGSDWILTDKEINDLINWYKEKNGNVLKIKSLKKGYSKTLKIQ